MAIVRKSDNVIQITINGGDGNPITITDLLDLEVVAYQLPKSIIQRWKLSDSEITIVNDAGGVVSVNFERANTKLLNFKNNACKMEVVALFTDTDFADNIRREVATDIDLSSILDSPTAYEL